jgi:hypothetical protein
MATTRRSLDKLWLVPVVLCACVPVRAGGQAQAPAPVTVVLQDRGQGIAPIYEGWYESSDGTLRVSFGYLSLNTQEELDIPIGADNRIEPGPADQGQPTHFEAKRKSGMFTVTIPKGSKQEVKWTITANGITYSVPSNLGSDYLISPLKGTGPPDLTSATSPKDNATPFARFSESGPAGQGPAGTTTTLNAVAGTPVPLTVWVTDDGVPRPRPGGKSRFSQGLTVDWSKFRGAGAVTFSNASPPLEGGKAVTQVTFSAPGEYMLVARVDDHGGQGQCCWTNAYVKATVR